MLPYDRSQQEEGQGNACKLDEQQGLFPQLFVGLEAPVGDGYRNFGEDCGGDQTGQQEEQNGDRKDA